MKLFANLLMGKIVATLQGVLAAFGRLDEAVFLFEIWATIS